MKRRFSVLASLIAIIATTLAWSGSTAVASSGRGSDGVSLTRSPSSAAPYQVHATSKVLYQVDPDGTTHELTVYAPMGGGAPWPSAVMIHGDGLTLDNWARDVASRGVVVFVPYWSNPAEDFSSGQRLYASLNETGQQLACAVRFAQANAAGFGGDPGYLSLFGFSAGANYGSQVVLGTSGAAPGCVTSSGSSRPDNAVLFEGDWMLTGALIWNDMLTQEPRIMDLATPWAALPSAEKLPVHILDSGDPSNSTAVVGWTSVDQWLPLRDPTGKLRLERGLENRDAFADGTVTEREIQLVLYDRMRHFGFDVTFGDLPNSCHCRKALDDEAALQMVVDAILADR